MLSDSQIGFIRSLGCEVIDYHNLSEDEYVAVEDAVSRHLQLFGFDENYRINEIGLLCESILDDME